MRFTVLRSVEHDGRRLGPGDVLTLDPAAAAPLVEVGAVEAAPPGAAGAPEAPADPPAREDRVRAALTRLDPRGDGWIRDGRPEVRALVEAGAPADLTAAERDEIWAAVPAGLIAPAADGG